MEAMTHRDPTAQRIKTWVAIQAWMKGEKPSLNRNRSQRSFLGMNQKKAILIFTKIFLDQLE